MSGYQSRGGGLDLEHIALPGVDDSGIAALDLARDVDAVVHVDVAVYEIFGFETVQKWEEGFKAAVGVVLGVSVAAWRGVCEQDVHAAGQAHGQLRAKQAPAHLAFRILVRPAAVHGASAETEYAQAVYYDQPVLNALAALGRSLGIAYVVVAVDIEQPRPAHRHEEAEVARVEVAAGEHEVVGAEPAGLVVVPEVGAFLIREQQELHSVGPSFSGGSLSR